MSATQKYLNICLREQWLQGCLWRCECSGGSVTLDPQVYRGAIYLAPIDSAENGFEWDRVKLDAALPKDGGIRAYALALDTDDLPEWPREGEGRDPQELFDAPTAAGRDFLLSGMHGRYLFLALELSRGGPVLPEIRSVSVRMGGDHMVDYLPGIYRGDDFTYRFLSVFNSVLQDTEKKIDDLSAQLDPSSAQTDMLGFISHWLCREPTGDEDALRKELPELLKSYETLYTPEGVRRSAKLLTGVEPTVIEHFSVDPNDPDCCNPELYRRLYGDDPYRFFLLYPQEVFHNRSEIEQFMRDMRVRIPAESEMELVLLRPCVRLDWHTYLGMNSRIGGYVSAAIDDNTTIHYDTIIGGEEQ
ncbi:MAG: hypothetical protein J5449_10640 [Oscillospiraceae bacterium]|nr:hypothetical protein [Oscillospiraceae bacterium]